MYLLAHSPTRALEGVDEGSLIATLCRVYGLGLGLQGLRSTETWCLRFLATNLTQVPASKENRGSQTAGRSR